MSVNTSAYKPTPFSGELTAESLSRYLEEEFNAMARILAETKELELRPVYAEPEKPRQGMLVLADGVEWNPGAGYGLYAYFGETGGGGLWLKCMEFGATWGKP